MYGADRMLFRTVVALRSRTTPLVVFPDDLDAATDALSDHLAEAGIPSVHHSVPVLRRAYINPKGFVTLVKRGFELWRQLRELNPQVVWCATSATLPAAPIARLAGVRHIILHNQEIWGRRERLLLGGLAGFCNGIIAISDASASSLPSFLRGRVKVISNGTEAPEAAPPLPPTDVPTFLVASRWNAWKGHATLLSAWEKAGQPGRLIIAGGPPPSGEMFDVRSAVDRLGLTGTVSIVGQQRDIAPLMAQAHFVVVPSDAPEPFGLIAIEAFANGRPVIASEEGGLGSIVTPGLDGYLFPNRDADALSEILRQASVRTAAEMSGAARASYAARYSTRAYGEAIQQYWTATFAPVRTNGDRDG